LEHFEDRSFVVAQVAYKIYEWMRKLGGTSTPRLIFYIDEIGSGGGKQAFYPSFPYESASKWGINYLIRQGRSQGVCCLLATQNPGDIDYKGLSNCGTWIVGKLGTDRDRKKVMEGMAIWGSDAERVRNNLTNADTGDFVIVINAEKIKLTGRKLDNKIYYSHSGYPGGIKAETARERLKRCPERIIEGAVWGMIAKGRLGRSVIKKLKVYKGSDHPHSAQKPEMLSV
jgi:ribosomal protein L13